MEKTFDETDLLPWILAVLALLIMGAAVIYANDETPQSPEQGQVALSDLSR